MTRKPNKVPANPQIKPAKSGQKRRYISPPSQHASSSESSSHTNKQPEILPEIISIPSSPNDCDTSTSSVQSTSPFETHFYICFKLDDNNSLIHSTTYLETLPLLHFWLLQSFPTIHKKEFDEGKNNQGLVKLEKEVPDFVENAFRKYETFFKGTEEKVFETIKVHAQISENQFDMASLSKKKYEFTKGSVKIKKQLASEMIKKAKEVSFRRAGALSRLLEIDPKKFVKRYQSDISEYQFTSSAICWITHLFEDFDATFKQDRGSGVKGNLHRKRLDFQVNTPFILTGEIKVEECLNGKDVNHSIEIAFKLANSLSKKEGYVLLIDRVKILFSKIKPPKQVQFLLDLDFNQESLCILFIELAKLFRWDIKSVNDLLEPSSNFNPENSQ